MNTRSTFAAILTGAALTLVAPAANAASVDRYDSSLPAPEPESVVTELRGLAQLHQAQRAANAA